MPLRIAVVVGSLHATSINRRVAEAMTRLAPDDLEFHFPAIGDLPLYRQDDDAHPAAAVVRFKGEIASSQGLLFATPEYNRSIPGVLKNAIDHASRPYGQSAWQGKPAAVFGVSPGAAGTAMAQQHLRNVLAYLDVPTLGQPELFLQWKEGLVTPEGDIGEASRTFLQDWMGRFAAWVRRHAG